MERKFISYEVKSLTTQLKIFEHVTDRQYRAERKILSEYNDGSYSLKQPYICVNPYLIAPLTALVMFETPETVSIKAIVHGKTKSADIVLEFPEAKEHVIEIIGLYAGSKNQVDLLASNGDSTTFTIETSKLPDKVLLPEIEAVDSDIWENQLVFSIPADNHYYTAGYDMNGDCRWYSNQKFAYSLKRGQNGRILVGAPRLLAIPYSPTTLYEMSLLGKVYKEYRIPRGYHHNYLELEDNKILFLTQNIEMGTSGDLIVLFDKTTAEIVKEWDLKNILPQDVAGSGSWDMHDWFHCNSIDYDSDTNSITVSGRHQDIIVNFDYETGEINWMLGDPECWPIEYTEKYFLQPEGELEWAYEPHAVQFINKNQLICFDSGHYRAKNPEKYVAPENNYSRTVVYQINPEAKTVKQIWQYGKDAGSEFYSTYMGNISLYESNHVSMHFGGSAKVDGIPIDMPGIFRRDFDPSCELYATTIELRGDKEICKMVLPMNTYQMERITLQEAGDVHQWGKGEKIGEYAPTEEFSMEFPVKTDGLMPENYNLSFGYDGERLFVRADFLTAEMVMLQLEGVNETHTFYIQSTRRPFYTMCPVTWRPGNGRPVEWPITVKDFNDCFKMKVMINENVYDTGLLLDLRKKENINV